ncbi:MAG TPA: hypothetical protein VKE98_16775, partial [Gemmataceae bacterium]|nr:hypothetical protein [Gemmataceae bacterium]
MTATNGKDSIKAIETSYNGYLFRSRLEARWAVFLDALGVPYEYEPQGFDMDGLHYLPDFKLPVQKLWLEIKPPGGFHGEDVRKVLEFGKNQTILAIEGNPWPWEYLAWLPCYPLVFPFPTAQWANCPQCHLANIVLLDRDSERTRSVLGKWPEFKGSKHLFSRLCRCELGMNWFGPDDRVIESLLGDAYRAARSARFEHGQK